MAVRKPNSKVFPKSGGFEKLIGFQVAELLYDFAVRSTKRFIEPGSSTFSATSKRIEMNLTMVRKLDQK